MEIKARKISNEFIEVTVETIEMKVNLGTYDKIEMIEMLSNLNNQLSDIAHEIMRLK